MSLVSEIRGAIHSLKERQRIYDHVRFYHGDNAELLVLNVDALEEDVRGQEKNLKFDQGLRDYCRYRTEVVSELSTSELIWLAKLNLTRSETYLQSIPTAQDKEAAHVNAAHIRGLEHNIFATDLLDKVTDQYKVTSRPRQLARDNLSRAIEEALKPSRELHKKRMTQVEILLEAAARKNQGPTETVDSKKELVSFMAALNKNLNDLSLTTERNYDKSFIKVALSNLVNNAALDDLTSRQLTENALVYQSLVGVYLAQLGNKPLPVIRDFVRICLECNAGAQYLLYLALRKEEMENADPSRN